MQPKFALHINDFHPKLRNGITHLWSRFNSQLNRQIKVFLDLNFWINIREAYLDNEKGQKYKPLLEYLIDLKSRNLIICPVSGILLEESKKQSIKFHRSILGALMGKLGDDYGLILNSFVYAIELEIFANYLRFPDHKIITPDNYVWRKGIHRIMDSYIEIPGNTTAEFNSYIIGCNASTSSLLERPFDSDLIINTAFSVAEKLNHEKPQYSLDYKNFSELRLIEFLGVFRFVIDNFPQFSSYTNFPKKDTFLNHDDLFYQFFPASYIYSSIMAVYRHHGGRKYKPNDLYDAEHAAVGIGYNDLYITERGIFSAIKNELKSLNVHFNCEIANNADDAINILQKMVNDRFPE